MYKKKKKISCYNFFFHEYPNESSENEKTSNGGLHERNLETKSNIV